MSNDQNRKLTPVGFAPFEEHRDTEQSALPPEAHEEEPIDERGTLAGFEAAFDKVSQEFNGSMNELRTPVIDHYQGTRNRLDSHAKTIRAHTAEPKELREKVGLPPIAPPSDDL